MSFFLRSQISMLLINHFSHNNPFLITHFFTGNVCLFPKSEFLILFSKHSKFVWGHLSVQTALNKSPQTSILANPKQNVLIFLYFWEMVSQDYSLKKSYLCLLCLLKSPFQVFLLFQILCSVCSLLGSLLDWWCYISVLTSCNLCCLGDRRLLLSSKLMCNYLSYIWGNFLRDNS
jgi:hypothetical protein